MSLKSPPRIAAFLALLGAVFTIASCGAEQPSPTSPSLVAPLSDVGPATAEFVVTIADETPAPPEPGPDDPAPAPGGPPAAPAPVPAPAPPPGMLPEWPPGPPPRSAPGVPVPTPPSTHFRVRLKIDPEPVPYSGQAITDVAACRNLKHTWFYDQYIHGETGVAVTFPERENFFDGRFTSKNGETIRLAGNGTVVLRTRWCSGYATFHYTQTRFKGKDEYGEAITISGPWARLLAP